jgi:hypothetical protein
MRRGSLPNPDPVQFAERLTAGDSVRPKPVRRLKAAHRALGQQSVATIDRSRAEPVAAQVPLQPAHLLGADA